MQHTKRILIVDDDRDFAEAIASFLEAKGYDVQRACNGADGIRLARMERPDLILMDIVMTERTEGFFAIHEIRRDSDLKTVPVFVLSSLMTRLPDFQIPSKGGWLAHDLFLPKPVDMAQLLESIRQRIGAPA
jgi:CheY-like chemotaxis protein